MKRPTKKPKEIREQTHLIGGYDNLVPDALRDIAYMMEAEGILSIDLDIEGYDGYANFQHRRMETPNEAERRYEKEYKEWKRWKSLEEQRKEKRRRELVEEAKKLGLKVEE